MTPAQGDIWWAEAEDRRQPAPVVTRDEAIPVLTRILVAPVTRTVRGIPTELSLDAEPVAESQRRIGGRRQRWFPGSM